MRKLMTILGAFLFASLVLTSCGSPEKAGEKAAKCICEAEKKDGDDQKKALEKCEKMAKKHEKKYKGDEDDEKAYGKAFMKAALDCE